MKSEDVNSEFARMAEQARAKEAEQEAKNRLSPSSRRTIRLLAVLLAEILLVLMLTFGLLGIVTAVNEIGGLSLTTSFWDYLLLATSLVLVKVSLFGIDLQR